MDLSSLPLRISLHARLWKQSVLVSQTNILKDFLGKGTFFFHNYFRKKLENIIPVIIDSIVSQFPLTKVLWWKRVHRPE